MADHWETRDFAVRAHASQLTNPVWIAGDSITEGNALREAKGRPVLNVGYGGIDVVNLRNRLLSLYASLVPTTLVVMVGTNDSLWAHVSPDQWRTHLAEIVIHANNAGVSRLVIAKAPRVEWKGLVAAGHVSPQGIDAVRHQAGFLASAWGLPVFDPSPADATGTTVDGVHLTPAAYAHLNGQLIPAAVP
jgi:lysophospholipase L1-like esterase